MTTLVEQLHAECAPLMGEIGQRNHVRVTKHTFQPQGRRYAWDAGVLIHDSMVDGPGAFSLLPDLARMDAVRIMAGLKPLFLDEAMRLTGGELRSVTPNLRVNVGTDYVAVQLGGAASTTVAKNIALTNNTSAPAAGDTSTTTAAASLDWGTNTASDAAASNSRGEYTATSGSGGGLQRAAATYAHTTSATSFTQTKTFTATGTCTAMQACGLFDALTQGTGTLFVENIFTPTSLATSDQLTIAWTLNI